MQTSGLDFKGEDMGTKLGTAAWKRQYKSVIIGVDRNSRSIKRLYVQNDGGMSGEFKTHHPIGGRDSLSEAVIVFNLMEVSSFPITASDAQQSYAAKLQNMLDSGDI